MSRKPDPPASPDYELLSRILRNERRSSDASEVDPNFQDVVFVCIDCEAYERAQHKITEIGIAILDTRSIKDVEPGENATGWISQMQYAHFRPVEHAALVNRRFLTGRENHFNFGTSTWIKLEDCPKILQRVFSAPAQLKHAAKFGLSLKDKKPNIILVGHALRNDENFLANFGFNIADLTNIVGKLDTQRLAGGTKKHSIGLQRLLLSLGLDPVNLHNGGNDAAYTLQAVLCMVVKGQSDPGIVHRDVVALPRKLPALRTTHQAAPHNVAGSVKPENYKSMSVLSSASNTGERKADPTASQATSEIAGRRRSHRARTTPHRKKDVGTETESQPTW